ncbi:hypothetical protein BS47DRAFT_1481670 [Hydnum rufescens UP504]|uniref:Uncharacterized protein n=1 Tax=Hydnum rufescens UP504 TaxID=1448309 RepID=A0A9P6B9N9_9AGAM|nr:hypothetical protein BS47DRAFT_1481670 [Hydnum rufescens UP504]
MKRVGTLGQSELVCERFVRQHAPQTHTDLRPPGPRRLPPPAPEAQGQAHICPQLNPVVILGVEENASATRAEGNLKGLSICHEYLINSRGYRAIKDGQGSSINYLQAGRTSPAFPSPLCLGTPNAIDATRNTGLHSAPLATLRNKKYNVETSGLRVESTIILPQTGRDYVMVWDYKQRMGRDIASENMRSFTNALFLALATSSFPSIVFVKSRSQALTSFRLTTAAADPIAIKIGTSNSSMAGSSRNSYLRCVDFLRNLLNSL